MQPVRLRREAEKAAVSVEPVGSSGRDELEASLFTSVDEALLDPPIHAKDKVHRIRAESVYLNDFCDPRRVKAAKAGAGFKILKHCGTEIAAATDGSREAVL